MTLIDTRPGIAATYRALSEQTGVYVDADSAVSRLGPPLEWEIGRWFPPERVAEVTAQYRLLYPAYAIEPCQPLPGAADALAAVRAAGGRVVVITAKKTELARLHLDRLGLAVDAVVGLAWARGKAQALIEHGASVYVGDHTADMLAARSAAVVGVGVTTGHCTAEELRRAGADTVLVGLNKFASWLHDG